MSKSFDTVLFSHGKESGPWGSKITAMAQIVRSMNLALESVDYRGMPDPGERVKKLVAAGCERRGRVVLVGSSLGGHVAAAAAAQLEPCGLFLLAPAFYMAGLERYTPQQVDAPSVIVHGWRDAIVPVENSIRWAREHRASLHLFESDHRLEDKIPQICLLLHEFLKSLLTSAP